jgi:hypothetical protein
MVTKRPRDARGRAMSSGADKAKAIRKGLQETERSSTRTGISRAVDTASQKLAQSEARQTASPEYLDAQARARAGDDSDLMPYQPTPSINPPRPRTRAAGYDRESQVLTVRFREGRVYDYYDVPANVWRNFRRVKSPGKFINRVLNQYTYAERNDLG